MGEGLLRKKIIGIEKQVDEFLDRVSEAGLLCKNGMDAYLKANIEAFEVSLASIRETEHQGDRLRRACGKAMVARTPDQWKQIFLERQKIKGSGWAVVEEIDGPKRKM